MCGGIGGLEGRLWNARVALKAGEAWRSARPPSVAPFSRGRVAAARPCVGRRPAGARPAAMSRRWIGPTEQCAPISREAGRCSAGC